MIDRAGKECCGCAVCVNICPKHCIRMAQNEEGFFYPEIQVENCVNCGACEKVCPVLEGRYVANTDLKETWAVQNTDQGILMNSSSGGMFTALACVVFDMSGCVFGAAFSEDFKRLHHIMAETPEELHRLRGSKYLQSETEKCYLLAEEQLKQDRWVLFCGTPCQIAGLRGFLGRDFDRLIMVDVICHGTPSVLLWQAYLKHIEDKIGGRAVAVSFRDKKEGWKNFGIKITTEGEKVYYCPRQKDPYMKMFLKNICLRESCYHCKVKETGPVSDITIGDLWGAEKIIPEMDSTFGISLAVVHTEKGRQFFEKMKESMAVASVDYVQALSYNPVMVRSVKRPDERDSFFSVLHTSSWPILEKRYVKDKLSTVIKCRISKSVFGKMIRVFSQK